MIIKKFVAKTEEEAITAAKKELGENVVVMNVKIIKRKGLLGLFGAKQTEVTVALEADNTPVRSAKDAIKTNESLENQVRATQTAVNVMSESSQSIEKKLDTLQNLLLSQLRQNEAKQAQGRDDAADEEVSSESLDKKESESGIQKKETSEQEKFIRILYNTMLENEVDEKYINQIIDDMENEREGKKEVPFEYILANVYQKLILKFGKADGISPAEKQPKVVVFMGPTGVGKTTTIAKIASKYSIEENKKIALITADTYRIAAAEQLRVYANILEVPFRIIYTEDDVLHAIEEFREYDYIFLDTTGHSHRNEEQLDHMKQLVKCVQESAEYQCFLVLSATTKYADLLKIVSIYKDIAKYQLIFTKLDETSAIGSLLNVKLYADAPIAFVTHGQNVPNDIMEFNPQSAVKRLLSVKQEDIY